MEPEQNQMKYICIKYLRICKINASSNEKNSIFVLFIDCLFSAFSDKIKFNFQSFFLSQKWGQRT